MVHVSDRPRGALWDSMSSSSNSCSASGSASTSGFSSSETQSTGTNETSASSGSFDQTTSKSDSSGNRSTPTATREFFDDNGEEFDPNGDIVEKKVPFFLATVVCSETYDGCTQEKKDELKNRMMKKVDPVFDYTTRLTHETMARHMRTGGQWVGMIVRFVRPGPIINFEHLTAPDEGKGWHFCSSQQAADGTIFDKTFGQGGTFSGWFLLDNGEQKFSSFFPLAITPQHLISFFGTRPVALYRQDNRSLHLFQLDGNPLFYIEAYYGCGGELVTSVFPIIYFLNLDDEIDIVIHGTPIKGEDLVFLIMDEEKRDGAIVFASTKTLVLDVTKLMSIPKVRSGVYLKVDIATYCI